MLTAFGFFLIRKSSLIVPDRPDAPLPAAVRASADPGRCIYLHLLQEGQTFWNFLNTTGSPKAVELPPAFIN